MNPETLILLTGQKANEESRSWELHAPFPSGFHMEQDCTREAGPAVTSPHPCQGDLLFCFLCVDKAGQEGRVPLKGPTEDQQSPLTVPEALLLHCSPAALSYRTTIVSGPLGDEPTDLRAVVETRTLTRGAGL